MLRGQARAEKLHGPAVWAGNVATSPAMCAPSAIRRAVFGSPVSSSRGISCGEIQGSFSPFTVIMGALGLSCRQQIGQGRRYARKNPPTQSPCRRQRNFSADVPEFTFTSTSKVENKAPSLAIARMR